MPVHTTWLDALMVNISFVGDACFAWLYVAFLFFFKNDKKTACSFLLRFLLVLILIQCVKNWMADTSFILYYEDWTPFQHLNGFRYEYEAYFPSSYMALFVIYFFNYYNKTTLVAKKAASILVLFVLAMTRIYLENANLFNIISGIGSGILCLFIFQSTSLILKKCRSLFIKYKSQISESAPSGQLATPS